MDDFERCVRDELAEQVNLRAKLRRRKEKLKRYEGERLVVHRDNGRTKFYAHHKGEPGGQLHYCGAKDEAYVKNVTEYKYLVEALKRTDANIDALRELLNAYSGAYPHNVVAGLGSAYQNQEQACQLLYGYANPSEWLEAEKKKKAEHIAEHGVYKPEQLRHHTIDGTATRSKGEMGIYNFLMQSGYVFIYEPVYYANGELCSPDFLIMKPNGQLLMIEHLGRSDSANYLMRQDHKIHNYLKEGWVPNVNLLLTFDDVNGNIDMMAISKIIKFMIEG